MPSIKVPDRQSFFQELNSFRKKTYAVQCPCCDRDAVVYWRSLNAGQCRVLIEMARVCRKLGRPDGSWVHIDEVFGRGVQKHRDWTMMRHWGLIAPKDKRTLTENSQGYWRVTETGYLFLRRQMTMPAHGNFYENACVNWDDVQVYIDQALGEDFDYQELMKGLL